MVGSPTALRSGTSSCRSCRAPPGPSSARSSRRGVQRSRDETQPQLHFVVFSCIPQWVAVGARVKNSPGALVSKGCSYVLPYVLDVPPEASHDVLVIRAMLSSEGVTFFTRARVGMLRLTVKKNHRKRKMCETNIAVSFFGCACRLFYRGPSHGVEAKAGPCVHRPSPAATDVPAPPSARCSKLSSCLRQTPPTWHCSGTVGRRFRLRPAEAHTGF